MRFPKKAPRKKGKRERSPTAPPFGFLYLLSLLLLLFAGHHNLEQARKLRELRSHLEELSLAEEELLKRYWSLTAPHRVLDWAERNGFVPMSEREW